MTATHRSLMEAPDELVRCPYMPTYGAPTVLFERGRGTELWDRQGKRYLDFLCGLAVTSLGHAHPAVAAAVSEQVGTLTHTSNFFATQPATDVAITLDRLHGGGGQVFFCSTGTEANEAAIKLARKWGGPGKYGIVSAYGSFHGRTMGSLAATGQPEKQEPFQPLPEGFRHVAWNDVDALTNAIDPSVAAIMLEPIQGEAGVLPATQEFIRAARTLCDERDLLLIMDEVQTGMARTGTWWGYEDYGIRPDVVTMAKALGNGLPIGAVWTPADVASVWARGNHGTTFGAGPVPAAAARAVLAEMEAIDAPALAQRAGARLTEALETLPAVAAVRGRGCLLAAELDGIDAKDAYAGALDAGLVINAPTPTSLRFAPPLNISDEHIDEGIAILGRVLDGIEPTP
jgi:predicted acetylornithine/succinylornithine family transaminase